ncbi:MAG: hypothetical protein H8F28_27395 [Fibrella sp.]|nr:hypothetical protein [Armatimonadota bacterium]
MTLLLWLREPGCITPLAAVVVVADFGTSSFVTAGPVGFEQPAGNAIPIRAHSQAAL